MLLSDVMDELGTALETVTGLRVFPYWADRIVPPAAVVGWPDPLTYDSTMARGSDECVVPVTVMVGKVDARTSRDALAQYADGAGAHSIKAALDGGTYAACDSVRVASCEFGVTTVAGVDHLSGTFQVEITGQGV